MTEEKIPSLEKLRPETARYKDLETYQAQNVANGVPSQVLERMAAQRVFPIMAPHHYRGRQAQAPLKSAPGLVVCLVECPPGNSAPLHVHEQTIENFFVIEGSFRIDWGFEGEHSLTLEQFDFCTIPVGLMRSFTNVSNELGRMLAVVHVQSNEQADPIAYTPKIRDEIFAEFGGHVVESLERIGMRFADVD